MHVTQRCLLIGLLVFIGMSGCKKQDDDTTANQTETRPAGPPDADAGKIIFARGCVTCHGPTGQGLIHHGPNLRTNKYIADHTDTEISAFLMKGRAANDPENKSGQIMPAGGTLPGFDSEVSADVVAYLRQMQAEESRAAHPATAPATLPSK